MRSRSALRRPIRFAFHELVTGAQAAHPLRRSPLKAVLRHATSDTWVFREVFAEGAYDEALALVDAVPSPRIVDLGGHVGLFSLRAAARYPTADIVLVEPDRENLGVLREVFAENAHVSERWALVPGAAGAREGTVRFVEDGSWSSHLDSVGHPPPGSEARSERRMVDARSIDVLPLIAGADLVKIDIEGGEWAVLEDPRLKEAGVGHLLLEYHGWACAEEDASAYATGLLTQAGFRCRAMPGSDPQQGVIIATREE